MTSSYTRRGFLGLTSAAALGAGLSACTGGGASTSGGATQAASNNLRLFTYEDDTTIGLLKAQVKKFDEQNGTTTTVDSLPGSGAAVYPDKLRTELLGGMADIGRAAARQRPQFARGVEADAGHDVADRQAISRHHRPERMAGGIPSDMLAFEDDNVHALARQFQGRRKAGKPGADHTDVDIRIQCQTARLGCVLHSRRGVGG